MLTIFVVFCDKSVVFCDKSVVFIVNIVVFVVKVWYAKVNSKL
jgi:hypothetical protein